jgi:radical SAM-linked protein
MMKYVVKFSKTGRMIYISHLDLTRMFIRALRRSGMRPAYSHGFNPHPKVGIALPLALGQYSEYELLELETDSAIDIPEAKRLLAGALPDGISVKGVMEKPARFKGSLASYVKAAKYEISCSGPSISESRGEQGAPSPEAILNNFMELDSVVIEKIGKKERKNKGAARPSPVDVRDRIGGHSIKRAFDNEILFEVALSAESGRVLSPADFCKALSASAGWQNDGIKFVVTRTAILGDDGGALI